MVRKKNTLPKGILVAGQQIPFNNIFTKFSKTEYGKILKSNIRFSFFKPKNIPLKVWEDALGKDVSNLYHLYVSLQITRSFLYHCNYPTYTWNRKISREAKFTVEEQKILLFTSVIHDWAEAVIGDIDLTIKKETDEDKELIILKQMVYEILGKGKDYKELNYLTENATSILKDKTSKLGRAFNAIEKIGYLRTGMKAWYQSRRIEGELNKKLKNLASRVVTVHTPMLIEYAEIYPPVFSYLVYRQKPILEVFSTIKDKEMDTYNKWLKFHYNYNKLLIK